MEVSKQAFDLIKKYEGFRNHPYLCPAGVPTIGYGTTVYPDGVAVKLTDPPITRKRASWILEKVIDVYDFELCSMLQVEVSQNQYDALICFMYNIGIVQFSTSTLLKRVNKDPNDPDIAYQFSRWNKARVDGKLQVLKGLVRRRAEESWLYFKHTREDEKSA